MDPLELRNKIRSLTEPTVAGLGFDLVAVEWTGARQGRLLRLSIDAPGGVNAEDCARVSEQLSPVLDAANPIDGSYTLEVSSPGMARPVQRMSDFERFRGYRAKIKLIEGPPRRRFTGVIGPIDGDELLLSVDGTEHRIALDTIEQAHLVLDLDEYQKLAEGSP